MISLAPHSEFASAMSTWTVAQQIGAVGLVAFAGYGFAKRITNDFDLPVHRPINERYCLSHCAGDAYAIHLGKLGGSCDRPARYFTSVTCPRWNQDHRMMLCKEHFDAISLKDQEAAKDQNGVWQEYPFPRNKRDELRFPVRVWQRNHKGFKMAQVLPLDALVGSETVRECGCVFRGWNGQVLFVAPCEEHPNFWRTDGVLVPHSHQTAPEWGHPAVRMFRTSATPPQGLAALGRVAPSRSVASPSPSR
jgi:hypothetical protein